MGWDRGGGLPSLVGALWLGIDNVGPESQERKGEL